MGEFKLWSLTYQMYSLHGHNQKVQSKSYSMQHKKEINLEKSSIWIPLKNSSDQHSMFIHLRIPLFHYPYLLYVTHTTEAGKCMTIDLFYSTNSIAMNTRLSI